MNQEVTLSLDSGVHFMNLYPSLFWKHLGIYEWEACSSLAEDEGDGVTNRKLPQACKNGSCGEDAVMKSAYLYILYIYYIL